MRPQCPQMIAYHAPKAAILFPKFGTAQAPAPGRFITLFSKKTTFFKVQKLPYGLL
jgi:hypothetical protein